MFIGFRAGITSKELVLYSPFLSALEVTIFDLHSCNSSLTVNDFTNGMISAVRSQFATS